MDEDQFTVMVSVPRVCVVVTPAPLAWTVSVNVTDEGGGGDDPEPPPPPPPQEAVATKSTPIPSKTAAPATWRRLRRDIFMVSTDPTARVMTKTQSVRNRPVGYDHGAGVLGGGIELTCTVSVSGALPLAGRVGAVGLKAHVVPVGTFKHWRFTVPVAPFCELSVMAKLADCPTERVAEVGVMLPVKAGGSAWTTSVALALRVNESAVPVTVNG